MCTVKKTEFYKTVSLSLTKRDSNVSSFDILEQKTYFIKKWNWKLSLIISRKTRSVYFLKKKINLFFRTLYNVINKVKLIWAPVVERQCNNLSEVSWLEKIGSFLRKLLRFKIYLKFSICLDHFHVCICLFFNEKILFNIGKRNAPKKRSTYRQWRSQSSSMGGGYWKYNFKI